MRSDILILENHMFMRILIALIALLLHLLSPGWFLNDYLSITDLLMLFSALFSIALFKLLPEDKWLHLCTLFSSINVLMYFITTVQIGETGCYPENVVYRLSFVSKKSVDGILYIIANPVELFNFIQVIMNLFISAFILIRIYKLRRNLKIDYRFNT
jgi:hypothetical protein